MMRGFSVRLAGLGVALLAVGCGGGGGDGGTGPCSPGAAVQLVTKSGDEQNGYFNNPLPAPLRVTALDAASCPVPGVVVNWAVVGTDAGAVSPAQSTTDANGVASTTDSIGAVTRHTITAMSTGVPGSATLHANATMASATAGVAIADFSFTPKDVVIQTGGTVTWTWGGAQPHSVTYDGGPTPLPASSGNMTGSGTYHSTITTLGKYTYHCSVHPTMTGSVTVVH